MNAIQCFTPEYNIQAFFRDLPFIRQQTFKASTIKHTFKDTGIWPVSFKAVQKKVIEYRKKEKLRHARQAENQWEDMKDVLKGKNTSDYELPELLPPQSYAECQAAISSIQGKINNLLSSPSRQRFSIIIQSTQIHLSHATIHELEIIQARARATGQLKNKEHSRKSLHKGKSLTAIKALNTLLKKRQEEANKEFKKATTAARIDINKKKNTLRRKGIQARKNKRERRRYTSQFLLGAPIPLKVPLELFTPIQDPKKEPNTNDLDSLKLAPDLDQALRAATEKKEKAYGLVYNDFLDYPVSSDTLEEERRRLCRPRLIVEVEQEIEEEMENDWQSEIEGEELLSDVEESDVEESDVESDKGYDSLAGQLDFVQFP
jgi:hypothetical protein